MLKNIATTKFSRLMAMTACLFSLAAAPSLAQQPVSPVAAPAAAEPKPKKPPTPKQLAAREKMKACGAEWREKKAAMAGTTWRQFSKECLARKTS